MRAASFISISWTKVSRASTSSSHTIYIPKRPTRSPSRAVRSAQKSRSAQTLGVRARAHTASPRSADATAAAGTPSSAQSRSNPKRLQKHARRQERSWPSCRSLIKLKRDGKTEHNRASVRPSPQLLCRTRFNLQTRRFNLFPRCEKDSQPVNKISERAQALFRLEINCFGQEIRLSGWNKRFPARK